MEGRDVPRPPNGYQIVHRIGSGQTAHVYLAEHERYGRVALKLPRDELAERPLLRRMFENEVMITLRMDHPRVVRGMAGHPTGKGAFLALELCPGGTLDQALLERGRLPLAEAARRVAEVAEGLAYVHGQKVLHRDVKPANVFLDDAGVAKLGDFGTGVFAQADDLVERVGTAFYMAPELFEEGAITVASDVYSLGVLAYEVTTGERPFRGDSFDALMHAHLGGLVRDPVSVRPDLPADAARVIRVALARTPSRRHAGVQAFLDAWRTATGLNDDASRRRKPPSGRGARAERNREHGVQEEQEAAANAATEAKDKAERKRLPWWRKLLG